MRTLALLLFLISTSAAAQAPRPACSDRKIAVAHLGNKFAETIVALGIDSRGGLVELLTSSDGNTWTIIVTAPNGISCLVSAGRGWTATTPEPEGPEA